MPRVLNYKTHGCPDNAVYIGRPVPSKRIRGSKWANPYPLRRNASPEQRVEVIAKYELYLYDSGLIKNVHELRGNDLVCWCAPKPCHGDVLLRLANAEKPAENDDNEADFGSNRKP
jgi:hypothetical protein